MEEPPQEFRTAERVYYSCKEYFSKRTLAPSEYLTTLSGTLHVPYLNIERLQNEVACMQFVKSQTDIPTPSLLGFGYSPDIEGSYYLRTARIQGVPMETLSKVQRSKVAVEVRKHMATLHALKSDFTGGPSGIMCPPNIVSRDYRNDHVPWRPFRPDVEQLVFCHGDLQCSNIMVDPGTLKVVGILDWEFAGFYPRWHELPFFEDKTPSGTQIWDFPDVVEQMKEFWAHAAKIARGDGAEKQVQ
jgi:aminoglycoside phosphotransferase (APT) family kinase protein